MKIKYLFAVTIFAILWESLLAHTRLFAVVDFFPAVFISFYLSGKISTKIIIYWSFFLGILLDLIIGRSLGMYIILIFPPIIALETLNKFFKLLTKERSYTAIIIFCILSQLLIYIIEIVNGPSPEISTLISKFIISLLLSSFVYWAVSRTKSENSIKV